MAFSIDYDAVPTIEAGFDGDFCIVTIAGGFVYGASTWIKEHSDKAGRVPNRNGKFLIRDRQLAEEFIQLCKEAGCICANSNS